MAKKKRQIKFEPPKKTKKILSYVIKYKGRFIFTALSGILYNTAIVFGPIFQGKLLDAALKSNGINDILHVGIQFILITVGFQVARFFKRYYIRDMANRMSGDMRIGILSSLLSTDLNTIEKQKVGDMMSRTIGDVDIVVEAIRKTITELWDTWVLMIAYFVTLMIYDVNITLISSIPIPLAIIAAMLMKRIVQYRAKISRKANSKTTSQIRKMISEVNLLRLYGREDVELSKLNEKLAVQAKATAIASVLQTGLGSIYASLSTIGILIVIALGSNKVIKGEFTVGEFTAYITMFTALATRTTTAAKVFNIQQGAKASWERLKGVLEQTDNKQKKLSGTINTKKMKVENLSFKYTSGENYVIKDLYFEATEGMIIGITGAVGSGKSSLGLALTGLYEYEPKNYIDENELREVSYEEKVANISYLGHNPFLFSDSFENNITWQMNDEQALKDVLNIACLKDDIEMFEHGLKTQVGEKGIKVSGGQKQRLALARALYKKAQIIILDDPFSAVDINTEAKIIYELKKYSVGKILFIISHRLSVFKYTDKVLVLSNGKLAEEGTHEQLIKQNGIYSKIMDLQNFIGDEINEPSIKSV
jgi:ATP-binding cassette subfamily B multidrug efflux pump